MPYFRWIFLGFFLISGFFSFLLTPALPAPVEIPVWKGGFVLFSWGFFFYTCTGAILIPWRPPDPPRTWDVSKCPLSALGFSFFCPKSLFFFFKLGRKIISFPVIPTPFPWFGRNPSMCHSNFGIFKCPGEDGFKDRVGVGIKFLFPWFLLDF